jgi:hypothetical protein
MTVIAFRDRPLGSVIEHYVDSRRDTDWPISLAVAVKTIRLVASCPQMSDRELAAVIATMAIAKRRNIAFDLETPPPMPSLTAA